LVIRDIGEVYKDLIYNIQLPKANNQIHRKNKEKPMPRGRRSKKKNRSKLDLQVVTLIILLISKVKLREFLVIKF
jgi:hypothetical protein